MKKRLIQRADRQAFRQREGGGGGGGGGGIGREGGREGGSLEELGFMLVAPDEYFSNGAQCLNYELLVPLIYHWMPHQLLVEIPGQRMRHTERETERETEK